MTVLGGASFGQKLEDVRSVCYVGLRDEFLASDDKYNLVYLLCKGVICKVPEGQRMLVVLQDRMTEDKVMEFGQFCSIIRVQLTCGRIAISGVTLKGETINEVLDTDDYYVKIIHIKEYEILKASGACEAMGMECD